MAFQLTNEQRAQIVILLDQETSVKEVARKFSINRSTVVRVRQKYLNHSTFEHLRGNGRPRKLNPDLLLEISKENSDNPRKSLRKLTMSLRNRLGVKISVSSVKNGLNSMNIFAFSPRKKPLLSKKILRPGMNFPN